MRLLFLRRWNERSSRSAHEKWDWYLILNSELKIDSKNICCKNDIMGRAWRIEYEGALYHILSHGHEQKDIFYDDPDRLLFLKTIGEMLRVHEEINSQF